MLDPYMVLGVGKYDDDQTVKKAYRQLSKQYLRRHLKRSSRPMSRSCMSVA